MQIANVASGTGSQAATPVAAATGAQAATTTNQPNVALTSNDFMSLLVAQLQNQDPLNPMDPNQMMTQLVEFNSLEELIQIQADLQPNAAGGSANTATNPVANQGSN